MPQQVRKLLVPVMAALQRMSSGVVSAGLRQASTAPTRSPAEAARSRERTLPITIAQRRQTHGRQPPRIAQRRRAPGRHADCLGHRPDLRHARRRHQRRDGGDPATPGRDRASSRCATRRRPRSWRARYAKWTGRLGCCLATSGPGGLHLLTGLYDAKFDRAPVLAITGLPYHDLARHRHPAGRRPHAGLRRRRRLQRPDHEPAHVENVVEPRLPHRAGAARRRPCRDPGRRAGEGASTKTERSERNVAHHASMVPAEGLRLPHDDDLDRAAELLNAAHASRHPRRPGALEAREELVAVADPLGAPVVKALLGKAVAARRRIRSRPAASACSARGRRRRRSSNATRC